MSPGGERVGGRETLCAAVRFSILASVYVEGNQK